MKKLILLLFITLSVFSLGDEYITGKIFMEAEDTLTPNDDFVLKNTKYIVKTSDKLFPEVVVEHSTFRDESLNFPVEVGDHVLLYKDSSYSPNFVIVSKDKRYGLFVLTGIFLLAVLVLGRKKGIRAIVALTITLLLTFYMFVPYVLVGVSPILLAVLTAGLSLVFTIYPMVGFSSKGHIAVIGSVAGVLVAGIISLLFVYFERMNGFISIEIINNHSILEHVKIKELIPAGIILGSMGAVMDVAISISSGLHEVELSNTNLNRTDIFKSGLNIGRDIIGTMINTLVLAYIGASLITILLIANQGDIFPMIRILNDETILVEILRSLCGSLGILTAVPITAYLAAYFYNKELNTFNPHK